MEASPLDWSTFAERMDEEGKAAALKRSERLAYLGGRVTFKRPKATKWRTVPELVLELGCSEQRVRALFAAGRFVGAKHRKRKGSAEWIAPARRQRDGTYRVELTPGKRGPKPRFAATHGLERAEELSPAEGEEVPF